MQGYYQFWNTLHAETLKNTYRGGDRIDALRFRDMNDENIKCRFQFEFYRKVVGGKFAG